MVHVGNLYKVWSATVFSMIPSYCIPTWTEPLKAKSHIYRVHLVGCGTVAVLYLAISCLTSLWLGDAVSPAGINLNFQFYRVHSQPASWPSALFIWEGFVKIFMLLFPALD
eukprot:gene9569-1721_t